MTKERRPLQVFAFVQMGDPRPRWYCGRVRRTKAGFTCHVMNGGWTLGYNITTKTVSCNSTQRWKDVDLIFFKDVPPEVGDDYNEVTLWGHVQHEEAKLETEKHSLAAKGAYHV